MRRLKPPTLQQWGCPSHAPFWWSTPGSWKVTHSVTQADLLHRVRYLRCRRCGLRVKTQEHLDVPWNEQDLVGQVKQLLPEGRAVSLRKHGITELPLAGLNQILNKHRLIIQASKGGGPSLMVACVNAYGKVEHYGQFELKRLARGTTRKRQ